MEFINENLGLLTPLAVFLIGWLLPPLRFNALGKTIGTKLPENVKVLIAERLDAFEKGLLNLTVDGNKSLISNDQLKDESEKLKIDLGLEESK